MTKANDARILNRALNATHPVKLTTDGPDGVDIVTFATVLEALSCLSTFLARNGENSLDGCTITIEPAAPFSATPTEAL